jgi:hypothetical protein
LSRLYSVRPISISNHSNRPVSCAGSHFLSFPFVCLLTWSASLVSANRASLPLFADSERDSQSNFFVNLSIILFRSDRFDRHLRSLANRRLTSFTFDLGICLHRTLLALFSNRRPRGDLFLYEPENGSTTIFTSGSKRSIRPESVCFKISITHLDPLYLPI